MRISTTIPQSDLRQARDAAKAVEAAGYTGVVTTESSHDPFLPLAVAAIETERLELATGIAISFARSPMAVAHATWDLNESSRGRFVLGLGTQIKAHNERRFSVPWSAPAPRMREYVNGLRAIWRCWRHGEPLAFKGEHYTFTLMTPYFTPKHSGLPTPAVTLAAVGPYMLRVSGEVADGVRLHPFCTRQYMEQAVMPTLEEGMARSGRKREHFEIIGGGFVATGKSDAEVAKMREWVRQRVAFYGSTPAYYPVFEMHGVHDLGPKLNRMTKAGQWDKIAAEVPDDVLDLFLAAGRHDEIKAAIEQRFGGISDGLVLGTADEGALMLPPDLVQELRTLPTRFTGYKTD